MPFPQSANGRESRLDISSFADKKLKDLKNRIDKDTGVFESTSWVENIKGDFVSIQELINQKIFGHLVKQVENWLNYI